MSGRTGSAALLVLFLTAALMLIASALWRGARANYSDAQSGASVLQARLAAEAGVGRTVVAGGALPKVRAGMSVALPGVVLVPGTPVVRSAVTALRVSPELYRIEAEGTAGRPAAVSSVAYLLWRLDPGSRVRALGAVAVVGGAVRVAPGGAVAGASVTAPPPPWAAPACSPMQSLADSIFPSGFAIVSRQDTTTPLALGLLDQAALVVGGQAVAGAGTPSPRIVGGGCVTTDQWNWGSPLDPAGPCGSHRPVAASTGDLLVSGGEGQGVLVVDGTLHLTGGAHYFGVVLASGDVRVDQGARIDGFVRAGGSVMVGPLGSVHGSACAALLALGGVPLQPVIRVPSGWVDPF